MAKLDSIIIKGARTHNLKSVDARFPRNALSVVTGVSGSGKSSLVFDTLYAEGHRRYVESLSSYARQFMARLPKPPVDLIQGISPAIAIEQRVNTSNPRSTVGSITEVYDFLRLLFARVGRTYSPVTGREVKRESVTDAVDFIASQKKGTKVYVLAALDPGDREIAKELEIALQKGFTRLLYDGRPIEIQDLLEYPDSLPSLRGVQLYLLIDRFIVDKKKMDEEFLFRVADSVQTAFNEAWGEALIQLNDEAPRAFSDRFEADGVRFEVPTVQLFNYNNPFGACETCEGFGRVMGIDEDLVIPDKTRSVREECVRPWVGPNLQFYRIEFERHAGEAFDFPVDKPYYELDEKQKDLLWQGAASVFGINDFFEELREKSHKVQNRIMLARYRGYARCPACKGARLRPEALYVKVNGYTIADLLAMSIEDLAGAFKKFKFDKTEKDIAGRIIREVDHRLQYLLDVGLGYLDMNRKANTLSGGETQRINLATSLGSSLVGSLYILDEPSVGLHPRDNDRLIAILESLRDKGNTVVVVEHDEGIMRRADCLVDMGPLAGEHGGEVVVAGDYAAVVKDADSLTGKFLSGAEEIPLPPARRKGGRNLWVRGAAEHNLKGVDAPFRLAAFNVVTGVSGSGKTTLVKRVLYPSVVRKLDEHGGGEKPGVCRDIELPKDALKHAELVDQNSMSRSARSNPVTYIGAYDHIRNLFASTQEAKARNLRPVHFSFNVEGGRCETCQGEGEVIVPMQFLPDVRLVCETCEGRRFKQVVLEVLYKEKSIYDVLNLTVEAAFEFLKDEPRVTRRLQPLLDVGLGYLRLGQSSSTLSGGEAQRLKLASFLTKTDADPTLYVFDEPTTGLHFYDVRRLVDVFQRLVDVGHTVVVIEHHLDVIKSADWLLDLGPEGGARGGELLYAGPPEGLLKLKKSHTGRYLKDKLEIG